MSSDYTDILRFFASCGLAVLFLFGHVYSIEYLGAFGLSLADSELGYIQAVTLGAALVFDIRVLVAVVILVVIASVTIWYARSRWQGLGFYVSVASLFLVFCYCSAAFAAHLARKQSVEVTTGHSGEPAICQLRDDAPFPTEFKEAFKRLTEQRNMRKILETETTIYLSPVVATPPEHYHGQSISISKDDIAYCRVIGQ